MKLTFLGSAHEVTGSRYLLEACGKRLMIDYGMEQGADIYENAPLPLAASEIDAVLVTHAHIDHTGHLPLLYKQGFRGPIYATAATCDLCRVMLLDSAHIQESDAEWKNRKNERAGKPLVEPLYDSEDAQNTALLMKPCAYGQGREIAPGITARVVDVGQLRGSASIELTVEENGEREVIVFSGDIGNLNQPLLRDPQYLSRADYVVMESTYGDRSHGPVPDYISALAQVIQETFDRGGNVIIPSFAVGRTQEMLYFIRQIKQEGRVKNHPDFLVYVDSPLANEATHVFTENTRECADEATLKLLNEGVNPIWFEGLKTSVTADDSKAINEIKESKVIISASGMCDAGRIRHHLKHNLWRPESTVLFVGYQREGTVGRQLVEGAKTVKLFGETIEVRASIRQLAGVSGHADNNGLMKWIGHIDAPIRHVFVTHGEDKVTETFAARLQNELHLSASAPYNGECWDLTRGQKVTEGNKTKLERPVRWEKPKQKQLPAEPELIKRKEKQPRPQEQGTAYGQLLAALSKLEGLVEGMRNRKRKDINRLSSAITALCRRFGKR